ncbi:MAG: type II toxin-antitoxin system RelB/DinJ family antitoxin [Spirochaetales bacterium]|nr:type II toxin-antitoxin system RelB/DinJ family antitoxin [Spirochaetales bacterium]
MAQAMVNFRMDSQLKNDMEKVCREMGLTPSAAYNLFAKKVTQERRIPFEITADPFYSAQNMDRLNKAISDIKAGRNMSEHELIEAD